MKRLLRIHAPGRIVPPGYGWRLVVLGLIALYFIQIDNTMKVRPDHAFLSLLLVALVLGNARRFLVDWSPFIILWIAYDLMRGIADDLAGRIHILAPYRLEERLFSWIGGGRIPAFAWAAWAQAHPLWKRVMDATASGFYAMHMAAPILLGWYFWNTLRDRRTFYRFMLAFCLNAWVSFGVYFLYPAAPPWYVRDFGFIQPETSFKGPGAGNLVSMDRWIGIPLFETVYAHLNPNKFAAIPSLHAAFPLIILIFCLKRFGRRAWPVALYPLGMCFAAVYLNHHYVIDLLAAGITVALSVWISERWIYPSLFVRGPLRRLLEEEPPVEAGGEARKLA